MGDEMAQKDRKINWSLITSIAIIAKVTMANIHILILLLPVYTLGHLHAKATLFFNSNRMSHVSYLAVIFQQ